MTKYCEMIEDPLRIRYALEKALYLAKHGRPGPCWIDIPLNFQGCVIDTDNLMPYNPEEDADKLPPPVKKDDVIKVLEKIAAAKRPVFYAGNGIRLANAFETFKRVVRKLNIPVVTGWNSIDLMEDEDPLYAGRGGNMGNRAGNFAVQNSDLVLAVGNRLSIRQVGYNWDSWAREAFVIMVDADQAELKKPTLHVEMPVHADALDFLTQMDNLLPDGTFFNNTKWIDTCNNWKIRYPVVQKRHWEEKGAANVYAFIEALSRRLPENYVTVVGNGSACVVGSHGYVIKEGQRFIINSAVASMGYDLPAAIGVCRALGNKEIVCITGDGSIQMNLQELQTILTNKLPIKIFVINNDGYHSIRQTQSNLFPDRPKIGIGPESGDLSFPSMEKLAWAYGYPYCSCHSNSEIANMLDTVFSNEGAYIAEVFVSVEQVFEPKSSTKKLEDGRLISPPLEDMAPFLEREEFLENMIIKPIYE